MDNDYSSYSREDLKDEIERLKANYERLQVAYRYEKNENDTLRADNERLKSEVKTLTGTNVRLSWEHDNLVADVKTYKERCADFSLSNAKLVGGRDTLRARVEELEAKLEDCLTMSMNMEGLFNDVHEERDALRLKLDAFQDTKPYVSKLIEDNDALRAELEQIKGEKMGEDRTWNLEPVTALRAENARLKANLDGTAEQNGFLSAQVREFGDQLKQVLLVNGRLSAELANLRCELEGKLQASWKESDELRAELAKAEFMRDAFQKSAIEYQAELAALKPVPEHSELGLLIIEGLKEVIEILEKRNR